MKSRVKWLNFTTLINIFESIGRAFIAPFSFIGRLFRKQPDYRKAPPEGSSAVPHSVDPREQQISDSAQTIRSILLELTTVTKRTAQAASDSTQALGDARDSMDRIDGVHDFTTTHDLLIAEIDKVIDSNTTLKQELARSQDVLVNQKQQIESLHTAVRIDGLTQVANRAYFDEHLDDMIKTYQRYNEPLSLVMIDVDKFKLINDTYGHQTGDQILKGVASTIKGALRESDFFARFGGDEFALILIKANGQASADVAWKISTLMRENKFLLGNSELKATLSIGVAKAIKGDTAENLLERADAALYRAKAAGRNCVIVASE